MKKLLPKNQQSRVIKNSVKFSPLVAALAIIVTGSIGARAVKDGFAASSQPQAYTNVQTVEHNGKPTAIEASTVSRGKQQVNLAKTVGGALLLVTSVSTGISLFRWARDQYGHPDASNPTSSDSSITTVPPLGTPPTQAG